MHRHGIDDRICVFIVSADIARLVDSPALLIARRVITALMTIICALSYGELAAMMPHAGGQYVYLREALGPIWGVPVRLDALPGDSNRHHRGGGCIVRQISRSFLAGRFLQPLDLEIGHVPALSIGSIVLGNMDIGLNTANLAAILIVAVVTAINVSGEEPAVPCRTSSLPLRRRRCSV